MISFPFDKPHLYWYINLDINFICVYFLYIRYIESIYSSFVLFYRNRIESLASVLFFDVPFLSICYFIVLRLVTQTSADIRIIIRFFFKSGQLKFHFNLFSVNYPEPPQWTNSLYILNGIQIIILSFNSSTKKSGSRVPYLIIGSLFLLIKHKKSIQSIQSTKPNSYIGIFIYLLCGYKGCINWIINITIKCFINLCFANCDYKSPPVWYHIIYVNETWIRITLKMLRYIFYWRFVR